MECSPCGVVIAQAPFHEVHADLTYQVLKIGFGYSPPPQERTERLEVVVLDAKEQFPSGSDVLLRGQDSC